jgi:1-acyl-sn-glycerol-3-phosphate acyltransferase
MVQVILPLSRASSPRPPRLPRLSALTLYRLLTWLLAPAAWWGRLRVSGLELVPARGPLIVVANHDSQWDPVVVALALRGRPSLPGAERPRRPRDEPEAGAVASRFPERGPF